MKKVWGEVDLGKFQEIKISLTLLETTLPELISANAGIDGIRNVSGHVPMRHRDKAEFV